MEFDKIKEPAFKNLDFLAPSCVIFSTQDTTYLESVDVSPILIQLTPLYPLIKTTSTLQRIFQNGYKETKNTLYRCNVDVA